MTRNKFSFTQAAALAGNFDISSSAVLKESKDDDRKPKNFKNSNKNSKV